MSDNTKQLYFGDNLEILKEYIDDEIVDLIYLDPPFQSGADYNVLFERKDGSDDPVQIQAFEDTWHWNQTSARAYRNTVEEGGDTSRALQGLREYLGESDMLAYLSMMAPRLKELRRVLKPTGTLYLHCDPTASHYLKILLDAVFGPDNFRNEIIWGYSGGGIPKDDFPRKHDTILRYSKTDEVKYEPIYRSFTPGTQERGRTEVKGKHSELREEGTPISDWWFSNLYCDECDHKLDQNVKRLASPTDKENLPYPTQKSLELMRRIIRASSDEGDIVLDPFCGCGTTVCASEQLNRDWIGIDITHLAINLVKHRLQDMYGPEIREEYEVLGEPRDVAGAEELADTDRHQFEFWALGLVGARPEEKEKGPDRGIDGNLYFYDDKSNEAKTIIISVKSGSVGPDQIRDLRGVVDREDAEIGVFITLEEPTREMVKEAASAGFYESPLGSDHPKIQIITIEDLLEGSNIDYPQAADTDTFQRAPRVQEVQMELTDEA